VDLTEDSDKEDATMATITKLMSDLKEAKDARALAEKRE
jgi:hypothetical protein